MRDNAVSQSKFLIWLILAAASATAGCAKTNEQQAANNSQTSTPATSSASPLPVAAATVGSVVSASIASASSVPVSSSELSNAVHSRMMMESAPGAANAAYDLQFLDTMIAHHKSAVEMARVAEGKAQRPELKQFARKIAAAQTREIKQMQTWREQWYAGKPGAQNAEMPGMIASTKGMSMDMLKNAAGPRFDMIFLNMMMPHHEGAVRMAMDALKKAEHPDVKQLAQKIIDEQRKEIAQMGEWNIRWSLPPR